MAVSYVTGYVANLLTLDSSLTPADISSTIKSKALTGVLTGIREFTNIYQCHMKLIPLDSGRNNQCLAQQRLLLKIVCSWWGSDDGL